MTVTPLPLLVPTLPAGDPALAAAGDFQAVLTEALAALPATSLPAAVVPAPAAPGPRPPGATTTSLPAESADAPLPATEGLPASEDGAEAEGEASVGSAPPVPPPGFVAPLPAAVAPDLPGTSSAPSPMTTGPHDLPATSSAPSPMTTRSHDVPATSSAPSPMTTESHDVPEATPARAGTTPVPEPAGEPEPASPAPVSQERPAAAPASLPATPPAPAPASPAAAAEPPARPEQVRAAVFPEVTSLVSRGDGTHRIVLTLRPESLGEVRVVMAVRDGAVEVHLAGGAEARLALGSGEAELVRLLEQAGATSSKVVVRDSADPAPGMFLADERRDAPQDRRTGTRADQFATDGDHSPRASQPPTTEPVTGTRSTGVDVSI